MSDQRRIDRVITIAEAMASSPVSSLPGMSQHPYDVKAAYQLLAHPEATPDNLQAGHRQLVQDHLAQPGHYLLIQDKTTFSWSGKQPISGLGLIGDGQAGLQGVHVHSTLAVEWPVEREGAPARPPVRLLGLADQTYFVRQAAPGGSRRGESSAERKRRKRESEVWAESLQRLGSPPETSCWTLVADREADIYEVLLSCQQQGYDYVIRAAQNRALATEVMVAGGRLQRLHELARQLPSLGQCELFLRGRQGQPERWAQLQLSACPVRLRAPWRPGQGIGNLPVIECSVVRVWEAAASDGAGLEWLLLCRNPVTSFVLAHERMQQYSCRWLAEELHKGIKTGLKAEDLQLSTGARLSAALALMSVVALRLIDLKERLRCAPEAAATEAGLSETELTVLKAYSAKPCTTVREVALALGRLGGHLNRKGDGPPGWITLWRGTIRLGHLVDGYLLACNLHEFG